MSTPDGETTLLSVRVHPKSRKSRHEPGQDGTLHVWVTAAAVDGAANKALLKYLSGVLSVPASRISLVTGAMSRSKRIRVELSEEEVNRRMGGA